VGKSYVGLGKSRLRRVKRRAEAALSLAFFQGEDGGNRTAQKTKGSGGRNVLRISKRTKKRRRKSFKHVLLCQVGSMRKWTNLKNFTPLDQTTLGRKVSRVLKGPNNTE